MVGIKKPAERKANLLFRFGYFTRPRESIVEPEFLFRKRWETCARRDPELSNEFSKKMTICFVIQENLCGVVWLREPTCKDKVVPPQYANLRQSVL